MHSYLIMQIVHDKVPQSTDKHF